ncbi:NAD(P)H-binding protein [Rhizobium sp. 007]|uniref:NmrA family NAD(P)-binding protein n=1 Tax=Rhizobium sp. 007 TaxID=2785056 RepID=UPI00188E2071|nr:NAD(P)H-binding protein [Rhizobium sp. 007]QPB22416.1 NAD(P)H-binding protein [Rhizobium sp. 007]
MFVVLGATGHIGSVVAETLLNEGHEVTAVMRDTAKAASLKSKGAQIAVIDVGDTLGLRAVFRRGRRAFLLNPPARIDMDTDAEENRTAASIAEAVEGSGLEKVLVESTYGAQPGDAIGDLSVLWNFETSVGSSKSPMAINRGAYYFTNLDMLLDGARDGTITTMFPPDLKIPMVAPCDLGAAAARRLTTGLDDTGIRYVEGPERYSFDDIAIAFANALGHAVTAKTIERADWETSFRGMGFSETAARAYARMTAATVDRLELPQSPSRGSISLQTYISELVGSRVS